MIKPYYQDNYVTIYHGDCRGILPQLPKVDLLLTDPPYGKKYTRGKSGFGKAETASFSLADVRWDKRPPKRIFQLMFEHTKNQIIWGGNYFIDFLTPTNCFLVWDKKTGNNPYADVELAWTSFNTVSRKFELFWLGSHIHRVETIYHPTQKPIALISWAIEQYSREGDIILDPFLGSGTTAYCAKKLNRYCIGIEIEEKYCEIAANRCRQMVFDLSLGDK